MQEKHMKYFKFLLNLYDIDSFFEEIEEVSWTKTHNQSDI
jgi:hypothetical protein